MVKILTPPMSLDVFLKGPEVEVECKCPCCDNSHTTKESTTYFDYNITHNLAEMAEAADLYNCIWRPEEVGIEQAKDLIVPLTRGLKKLKSDPAKFKALAPSNGWGTYEGLIVFVTAYLDACMKWPDATIEVDR